MKESDRVLRELEVKFSGVDVIYKRDSLFMKIINVLLMIITFGQMKSFMNGFTTTIGKKIYVHNDWDLRSDFDRAITLRHEGVHLAQQERYGFFKFVLMYLFWPMDRDWET